MNDWQETQAVRSIHALVDNQLRQGFAELDCRTADVRVRQQLYATLVHKAICMARQRLPENPFLDELINASKAEAQTGTCVERTYDPSFPKAAGPR